MELIMLWGRQKINSEYNKQISVQHQVINDRKRTNTELHKGGLGVMGGGGREWFTVFNELIGLGLVDRLESGQGISHMWGSIQSEGTDNAEALNQEHGQCVRKLGQIRVAGAD